MKADKTNLKILKILLKDLLIKPTITSLAKETGMSRVGTWKTLKKLEKEKLILLSPVGTGKTSAYLINLNWGNPITEKNLVLALTEDAIENQRWINNFAELEDKVKFLIIYGSIINHFKEADDIDILGVTNKNNFSEIDESVKKIQKTQLKKIHALNFTQTEFNQFITDIQNTVSLNNQNGEQEIVSDVIALINEWKETVRFI